MNVHVTMISAELNILGETDVDVRFKGGRGYPVRPPVVPIYSSGHLEAIICRIDALESTFTLPWPEGETRNLKAGCYVTLEFERSGGVMLTLSDRKLDEVAK